MKRSVLTLDRAGRVVLPKPLRTRLGLRPGAQLEVSIVGGDIQLHPAQHDAPVMVHEHGWLVYTGTATEELQDPVREHRSRRLRSFE